MKKFPKPTKAIICAAGLGTRFLPQTKAMPKEMLPIIDRPVIQLIVEEAVKAGVTEIIIVTGSTKRSIEDHFDRADELENELEQKGKHALANKLRQIAELANFVYVRQKGEPKGNARPILNAAHLISQEPFYVFFADDFFRSKVPRATQLRQTYQQTGESVISLIEVEKKDADKYGMAELDGQEGERTFRIKRVMEKPGEANTPSHFASVGGYLLTPDILPIIEELRPDKSGEIVLANAINQLASVRKVYGRVIEGVWHDTGDQLKYLQAVVDTALTHPRLGPTFEEYLRRRLK